MNNPFHIPNLNPLYEEVKAAVLKAQGTDEFLLVDDDQRDTIWTMVFENDDEEYREYQIKALRVKNDILECIYDLPHNWWTVKDVETADELRWSQVRYDDYIYFVPTIFSIAENLPDYLGDEPTMNN